MTKGQALQYLEITKNWNVTQVGLDTKEQEIIDIKRKTWLYAHEVLCRSTK